MTTIDRLISDALAGRRAVSLPGEGTLEVKRRGAKMISDTELMPPHSEVVLTPGEAEGAESVISLIMADRGVGEDEAGAMYGSWLESARREDGALEIEGVGKTGGDGFTVAEELDAALNPEGEEPLVLETEKGRGRAWLWMLIGILAALLILGGILLCQKGCFGSGRSKTPVVETVVNLTPTTDPVPSDGSPAADETPATPAGPRFHVIAGAFKIESNADNYIARLKREHPELTPEKVFDPAKGYNMVSILQAPTRREASRKMNLWWDIGYDLWIYEQK